MDGRGILDTSVIVNLDHVDAADLPAEPLISAITLAELTVGPLVAVDDGTRAARQARLQAVESSFDPIPFDAAAARAFGTVSASLRGAGRKRTARAFDVLIAATAIANEMPVYTCNRDDFDRITGLDVVEVTPR